MMLYHGTENIYKITYHVERILHQEKHFLKIGMF